MKLTVNGQEVAILTSTFYVPPFLETNSGMYAKIFADGIAEVCLEYDKEVTSAMIRPQKAGIPCIVENNCVKFTLCEPCNISVEINGGIEDAVLLFLDHATKEVDAENYKVLRFGGEQHIDILDITEDNTLIWLEDDAVIHGKIRARGVNGLKICGHGTITMREYGRDCVDINTRCVDILQCSNVEVRDILISDSTQWSFRCDDCENVIIDNVKVLGFRSNNDGFDICGSRNVHMLRCFVRSWDDAVSVKGLNRGNIDNVLVEKCVFWNDMARSMNVGSEISCDYARNIVFRDIDVIHNLTSYPICQVHNGDRGIATDISFEDIRVEHAPYSYLFDLRIKSCYWNQDSKNGYIENIRFKDIQILGEEGEDFTNLIARAEGVSEEAHIANVTVENLTVFGKKVTSAEECGLSIYDHCHNIQFIADEKNFNGLEPEITLVKAFEDTANGKQEGILRVKFTNQNDVAVSGRFGLQIFPKNSADGLPEYVEYSLAPEATFEKDFTVSLQPGRYVAQTVSDQINLKNGWLYFEVIGTLTEQPQRFSFRDCHGNIFPDVFLSVRNDFLILETEDLPLRKGSVYTALPVPVEQEEVLFTCEECDWGEVYAIKQYNGKPDIAFELGNPQEITLVYLNMPKTKINRCDLGFDMQTNRVHIPFAKLGMTGEEKEILLEIALGDDVKKRYCRTLFRSVDPDGTAHMFAKFRLK